LIKKYPTHRPKQVEYIEQKRRTDCGIACVAMITRHLYDDIVSIFPELSRSKGGLYPDDVLEVIEELDYNYNETDSLPNIGVALVAIQWKAPKLPGHYVVWDSKRKQFLDPINGIINKREMLRFADMESIWRITKG
jgi:ABC-type bacteriocin/lantibiotic exporter with double-glycine peptidase domain